MTNQNDRNRDRRSNAAGNNQRDRENDTKKQAGTRPWGRAAAIIDVAGTQRAETKARFVPIGAVWETEGGNLKMTLEATPNQWDDPHYRRVILITKNEDQK